MFWRSPRPALVLGSCFVFWFCEFRFRCRPVSAEPSVFTAACGVSPGGRVSSPIRTPCNPSLCGWATASTVGTTGTSLCSCYTLTLSEHASQPSKAHALCIQASQPRGSARITSRSRVSPAPRCAHHAGRAREQQSVGYYGLLARRAGCKQTRVAVARREAIQGPVGAAAPSKRGYKKGSKRAKTRTAERAQHGSVGVWGQ